jgi:hypothetical protein
VTRKKGHIAFRMSETGAASLAREIGIIIGNVEATSISALGGAGLSATEHDDLQREYDGDAEDARERLTNLATALTRKNRGRPRSSVSTFQLPRDGIAELAKRGMLSALLSSRLHYIVEKLHRANDRRSGPQRLTRGRLAVRVEQEKDERHLRRLVARLRAERLQGSEPSRSRQALLSGLITAASSVPR